MSSNFSERGQSERKPGGNVAFGGGEIDRSRKLNDVDSELIASIQNEFFQSVRTGKKSTEHFAKMGKLASMLKQQIGHGYFGRLVKMYFPHISMRTIQRAIQIANFYNFDQHPILLLVPRSQLYNISKQYDGLDKVLGVLEDNWVTLEIDENNDKELKQFLIHIKALAKGELEIETIDEDEYLNNSNSDEDTGWTEMDLSELQDSNDDGPFLSDEQAEITPMACLNYVKELKEYHDEFDLSIEQVDALTLTKVMQEIILLLEHSGPPEITPMNITHTRNAINLLLRRIPKK